MVRNYAKHTPRRRAVAAVEFAFLAPPLLILLVGIWEIGRLIEVQQMMVNAAREGGRQAATGQLTNTQVQQVVTQYLQVAGLPTTNVNVTVTDLTTAVDVSQAQYLDRLQVTATIPLQDVRWSVVSYFMNPGTTLKVQVEWITMVDKAFPTPPVPPVG
jgi:Flp pilus assembly protein TadG